MTTFQGPPSYFSMPRISIAKPRVHLQRSIFEILQAQQSVHITVVPVTYKNTVFRDGNASLLSTIYFNTGLSHLENNNMGIESDSIEKKNYSIQNQ